ncbi:MAG: type II toxin-antitoxin system RelE family toxin [Micromonosporaceae bacterium]
MTNRYRIDLSPAAERQLRKLDRQDARRLAPAIQQLAVDPRPRGYRALTGRPGEFRIRVGDWRVVYEIADRVLRVLVLVIAHRREVQRDR